VREGFWWEKWRGLVVAIFILLWFFLYLFDVDAQKQVLVCLVIQIGDLCLVWNFDRWKVLEALTSCIEIDQGKCKQFGLRDMMESVGI
jgi:hypothetical protein